MVMVDSDFAIPGTGVLPFRSSIVYEKVVWPNKTIVDEQHPSVQQVYLYFSSTDDPSQAPPSVIVGRYPRVWKARIKVATRAATCSMVWKWMLIH